MKKIHSTRKNQTARSVVLAVTRLEIRRAYIDSVNKPNGCDEEQPCKKVVVSDAYVNGILKQYRWLLQCSANIKFAKFYNVR